MRSKAYLAGLILLVVGGAGCLRLQPQPDDSKFHVLPSVPGSSESRVVAGGERAIPVFVSRASLPGYLENPAMVMRLSDTELVYSGIHYWAEPLGDGVTRVLQQGLASGLGAGRVHPAATRRPSGEHLDVQVTLSEFEARLDGQVLLGARWGVFLQPGSHCLESGESRFVRNWTADPSDPSRGIQAMGACLGDLAEVLAASITSSRPRQGSSGSGSPR